MELLLWFERQVLSPQVLTVDCYLDFGQDPLGYCLFYDIKHFG